MRKRITFLSLVTLLTICSCSFSKPSSSENISSSEDNPSSSTSSESSSSSSSSSAESTSSSSATISSESSSSSESSDITISTEEITFNTSSESTEITSSVINLPSTMSYDSSSKVFGGTNVIRFGSSKASGTLKINIRSCQILSITLIGKTYNTDADVGIKVALSNGETKNVVVNSSFSEELDFEETSSV